MGHSPDKQVCQEARGWVGPIAWAFRLPTAPVVKPQRGEDRGLWRDLFQAEAGAIAQRQARQ
eukprot:4448025-Amphidinium_carterae.2